MAFGIEVVLDVGVDGDEFLQRLHSSEPQHRSLSSSKRKVRIFRPVVLPPSHLLAVEIAQFAHRCRVGPQPVNQSATAIRSTELPATINIDKFTPGLNRVVIGATGPDNIRGKINSFVASSVPEPSTWATMLFGFAAIGAAMRRQRKTLSFLAS